MSARGVTEANKFNANNQVISELYVITQTSGGVTPIPERKTVTFIS